jgi:hypothetical protein
MEITNYITTDFKAIDSQDYCDCGWFFWQFSLSQLLKKDFIGSMSWTDWNMKIKK